MFIKVTKDTFNNKESMLINVNQIKSISANDIICYSEEGNRKINYHTLIRLIDGDFENVVETPEEIESMLKKQGLIL